jgi:hypothetical protein
MMAMPVMIVIAQGHTPVSTQSRRCLSLAYVGAVIFSGFNFFTSLIMSLMAYQFDPANYAANSEEYGAQAEVLSSITRSDAGSF